MIPIAFKEHNVIIAKDQRQYKQLPAHSSKDGKVVTCWKLSFTEWWKFLFTGKMWLTVLTFNNPLQPLKPEISKPAIGG